MNSSIKNLVFVLFASVTIMFPDLRFINAHESSGADCKRKCENMCEFFKKRRLQDERNENYLAFSDYQVVNEYHKSCKRGKISTEELKRNDGKVDFKCLKLTGADFRGADLQSADFCSADLTNVDFRGANLKGAGFWEADLTNVDFRGANLKCADFWDAGLTNVDFRGANLQSANFRDAIFIEKADFRGAGLQSANFRDAKLTDANFRGAELRCANFKDAEFTDANFSYTDITKVDFKNAKFFRRKQPHGADFKSAYVKSPGPDSGEKDRSCEEDEKIVTSFQGASLVNANFDMAVLTGTNFSGANLQGARFKDANLEKTNVSDANFAFSNLTNAVYTPDSPPPKNYLVGIKGLRTVEFPKDYQHGLVQLRDLLRKSGLRSLEREATFAIEKNKVRNSLKNGSLSEKSKAWIQTALFEFTVGWGLYPERALYFVLVLIFLPGLLYAWVIRSQQNKPCESHSIFRIRPQGHLKSSGRKMTIAESAQVEHLTVHSLKDALRLGFYFSLLSTFRIGWRDIDIGTWLVQMQFQESHLRGLGRVRFISGVQSLVSAYLLVLWALTYFGRPFQ